MSTTQTPHYFNDNQHFWIEYFLYCFWNNYRWHNWKSSVIHSQKVFVKMTPTMSKQIISLKFIKNRIFSKLWYRHGFQLKASIQSFLRFVLFATKSIEHLKINKSVFELPPLDLINIILNWASILSPLRHSICLHFTTTDAQNRCL